VSTVHPDHRAVSGVSATGDQAAAVSRKISGRDAPAVRRVRANKGAAGVDGLDIDQTAALLITPWPAIRDSLLKGRIGHTRCVA
jgi:hypothetical protein